MVLLSLKNKWFICGPSEVQLVPRVLGSSSGGTNGPSAAEVQMVLLLSSARLVSSSGTERTRSGKAMSLKPRGTSGPSDYQELVWRYNWSLHCRDTSGTSAIRNHCSNGAVNCFSPSTGKIKTTCTSYCSGKNAYLPVFCFEGLISEFPKFTYRFPSLRVSFSSQVKKNRKPDLFLRCRFSVR